MYAQYAYTVAVMSVCPSVRLSRSLGLTSRKTVFTICRAEIPLIFLPSSEPNVRQIRYENLSIFQQYEAMS